MLGPRLGKPQRLFEEPARRDRYRQVPEGLALEKKPPFNQVVTHGKAPYPEIDVVVGSEHRR